MFYSGLWFGLIQERYTEYNFFFFFFFFLRSGKIHFVLSLISKRDLQPVTLVLVVERV